MADKLAPKAAVLKALEVMKIADREAAEKQKAEVMHHAGRLVEGGKFSNGGLTFSQALKAKWPVEAAAGLDDVSADELGTAVSAAMERGNTVASILKHIKSASNSKKLDKLEKELSLSQVRSLLARMEKAQK